MGLIDRIKRRLPIIGSPPPAPTSASTRSYSPPPPADEPPAPRSPRGEKTARQFIEETVQANPVVLFMKGTPDSPQCGFSANAAGILSSYGRPFSTVNVLADEEIREVVKEVSAWPTLPQIFIKGEFVGGADILRQLHDSGELKGLLEDAYKAPA